MVSRILVFMLAFGPLFKCRFSDVCVDAKLGVHSHKMRLLELPCRSSGNSLDHE